MNDRSEYRRERRSYVVGLTLAIALTAVAFGSVALGQWPRRTVLWIIATSAVVQVGVHFRYFLHIDLSRSKRDDLQLIVFSFLIVLLMAGGTIWLLGNLRGRMM
jgi:cytochrome o ubiquinol oxidase operon protein cyoD